MLFVARSAVAANRHAPKQTRRVNAQSRTLAIFGADMVSWMDPNRTSTPVGSTINSTPDCSPRRGTITQSTPAKRPLCAMTSDGVKGFTYDGVDDGLVTDTLTLGTTGMTVAFLTKQSAITTDVCMAETGALSSNGGFVAYRTSALANRAPATYMPQGGASGDTLKTTVAIASNVWLQQTHTMDRTLADITRLKIYSAGAQPASSGNIGNPDLATFSNNPLYIGWRGYPVGTGSIFFQGTFAQMIALKRAVSASEAVMLYRLLYEIAGLAW